jgi:hypothetical protein
MTIAEKYKIRTTLNVKAQRYYDNLSEVSLCRYLRFAQENGQKIRERFIRNLYNKKFLKLFKERMAITNRRFDNCKFID